MHTHTRVCVVIWTCPYLYDPPSKDRMWWSHCSLACLCPVSGPHWSFTVNAWILWHTCLPLCKPPSLPTWILAITSLFSWKPLQSSAVSAQWHSSHHECSQSRDLPLPPSKCTLPWLPSFSNQKPLSDSTQEVFYETPCPPFLPSLCPPLFLLHDALAFYLIRVPCTTYSLCLLVSVPSSTWWPSTGSHLTAA